MNTMTTMKMSYHARVERLDRLVACMTHIGYNEFAYEIPDPRSPSHLTGESVEMLSGYSYDYTTYLEINGESSNIPSELCAIYLVDDGWKVLNSSPKSLG